MDPISSLQFAVSPELRLARIPRADGISPQAIPADQLRQVSGTRTAESQTTAASAPTFESTLGKMVADVNERQVAANEAVAGVLTGQNTSLHQAMIAMEEASVSFQLMVEVRNKLLESYQELMRMQV